jgi:hypothetical protein
MLLPLNTECLVYQFMNRDVMAIVLALSAVDRGFEPSSDQTNEFEIGICCFSTKHSVYASTAVNVQKLKCHCDVAF